MYQVTTTLKKILKLKRKIKGNAGGTSAGKTIAILLILIDKAQSDKKPTLTSVFAESNPVLKRGVLRDFKKIMQKHNYWKADRWNATDKVYTFENESQIEFVNADEPEKFKGSRRDRAYLNEANNITYRTFEEIEIRTSEEVYLDWNPTNEFWFYTKLKGAEDVDFLITTYLDNEFLDLKVKESIERKKDNDQWWRVYGEGKLGEVEGRIYTGWRMIDKIPFEARLISRGLDFGYTNDPTALIDIYEYNGGYILDEVLYQKGLSNREIAQKILAQEEQVLVIADSAEPKSIDEIKSYGVDIEATQKGAGSINTGISWIQDQKISYTKHSRNLEIEYKNWMWRKDKKLDEFLNKSEDAFNHLLDAMRYGLSVKIFKKEKTTGVSVDYYRERRFKRSLKNKKVKR